MENERNNDSLPKFWLAVSGFFLYFKHRSQSPLKARKALISGLSGIPVGIAAGYALNNYMLK